MLWIVREDVNRLGVRYLLKMPPVKSPAVILASIPLGRESEFQSAFRDTDHASSRKRST
jgi:hypothetical protein